MERTHAPAHGAPGRAERYQIPNRGGDALPAALLGLQRSAGNAATARVLQRAPHHTRFAPAAGRPAITDKFRTDHIGEDWEDAISQHADRGTYTWNTFVKMTDAEARTEIADYLYGLHKDAPVESWGSLEFETNSLYLCFETTLLDNDAARYQVRRVWAKVNVSAWWMPKAGASGAFQMGHMDGIAAVPPGVPDETWVVQRRPDGSWAEVQGANGGDGGDGGEMDMDVAV